MSDVLSDAVAKLQFEFCRRDYRKNGLIPKPEFICVLIANGGLLPQIEVLCEQFIGPIAGTIDYRSFMDHLKLMVSSSSCDELSSRDSNSNEDCGNTDEFVDRVVKNVVSVERSISREPTREVLPAKRNSSIPQRVRLQDVFRVIDSGSNGLLSFDDIVLAFARHNIPLLPSDAEKTFLSVDSKSEGAISFANFCTFVARLPSKTIDSVRDAGTWPELQNQANTTSESIGGREIPSHFRNELHSSVSSRPSTSNEARFMQPTTSSLSRAGKRCRAEKLKSRQGTGYLQRNGKQLQERPSNQPKPCNSFAVRRITLQKTSSIPVKTDAGCLNSHHFNEAEPKDAVHECKSPEIAPPEKVPDQSHPIYRFAGKCSQILALCTNVDKNCSGKLGRQELLLILRTVEPSLTIEQVSDVLAKHTNLSIDGYDYVELVGNMIANEVQREESRALSIKSTPPHETCVPVERNTSIDKENVSLYEQLRAGREKMRKLLQNEFIELCGGSFRDFIEQFLVNDPSRMGYLDVDCFKRVLNGLFQRRGSKMPGWIADRCVKISRIPFTEPDSAFVSPIECKARCAASQLPLCPSIRDRLCDYRFLAHELDWNM